MNDCAERSIEGEARRIAEQSGVKDLDGFLKIKDAMRFEAYRRAIEPIVQQKVDILSLRTLDRIILKEDGTINRVEYKPLPPGSTKALEILDELIAMEAKRYGLPAADQRDCLTHS